MAAARIFGQFTVYRQTAAVVLKPVPPRFKPFNDSYGIAKPGCVLLEFVDRGTDASFNWQEKSAVALTCAEIGSVAVVPPGESLTFKRSRFIPLEDRREVVKELTVTPTESGVTMCLDSGDAGSKSIDVTHGEFFVMKTLMFHSLPYLAAFPQTFDHLYIDNSSDTPQH